MKSFVRHNLLEISENAYNPEKIKLFRHLITQVGVVLFVFIFCLSAGIYHSEVEEKYQGIQSQIRKKNLEIDQYISANKYINSAINNINEINMVTKETTSNKFLKKFNNVVSYLSYYHRIYEPINSSLSNITSSSTTSPINMTLKVKTQTDQSIFRFIDSLSINLDGFLLTKKIEIYKDEGHIIGDMEFEWYTGKKIKKACMGDIYRTITPSKPEYSVEERCSISIWHGNLLTTSQ